MSRNLHEENYYVSSGGQVPVKWTAPEVIFYSDAERIFKTALSSGTSLQEVLHSQ